jgi:hypothetical protein
MDSPPTLSRRRLQVVADADPGSIARIVERFQNLNIIPRRICAEFSSNDLLHIEMDVCGVADELLALIVGKIQQSPCIVNAYWHRLDTNVVAYSSQVACRELSSRRSSSQHDSRRVRSRRLRNGKILFH